MAKRVSPSRLDPSRTVTIRRALFSALRNLLEGFRSDTETLITGGDAFGIFSASPSDFPGIRQWMFLPSEDKLNRFDDWLSSKLDRTTRSASAPIRKYVSEAFMRGAGRAYDSANVRNRFAADSFAPHMAGRQQFQASLVRKSKVVDFVSLLSARAVNDVRGAMYDMTVKFMRALSDVLVSGSPPSELSKKLKEASLLTAKRLETTAYTEIVRAQAEGVLTGLSESGVEKVLLRAEWTTAGNGKVCPKCAPLDGEEFTVAEARGVIPRHPKCLCSWAVPKADRRKARQSVSAVTPPSTVVANETTISEDDDKHDTPDESVNPLVSFDTAMRSLNVSGK